MIKRSGSEPIVGVSSPNITRIIFVVVIVIAIVGIAFFIAPEQRVGKVGELRAELPDSQIFSTVQLQADLSLAPPQAQYGPVEGSVAGQDISAGQPCVGPSAEVQYFSATAPYYRDGDWQTNPTLTICCPESANYCGYPYSPQSNDQIQETREITGYCYGAGSIMGNADAEEPDFIDHNLYCARSYTLDDETNEYAFIRCDDSTTGQLTEDNRFRCDGDEWVEIPGENCAASGDEDFDGKADCADDDCFDEASCVGESCAAGKVVVWSSLIPTEDPADEVAGTAPARRGCCEEDQCIRNNGACVNQYQVAGADSLCDANNDWLKCTAELDRHTSTDGLLTCNDGHWGEYICNAENAMGIRERDGIPELCNRNEWQSCERLMQTSLVINQGTFRGEEVVQLFINHGTLVLCSLSDGDISVLEAICNNGIDDDNDGDADIEDSNCDDNLDYRLGEMRNEIVVRQTDDFTITLTNEEATAENEESLVAEGGTGP